MTPAARSCRTLAIGAALTLALAAPAASEDLKVVADGLDNPRGLAFGPGNDLYVAESGRGGSGPCRPGPGPGDPQECLGTSGAVTRVDLDDDGDQRRITTGLPSFAGPPGGDAIGPSDVSFPRRSDDDGWDQRGFLTVGLGGDPATNPDVGAAGAALGKLHRLWPDGRTRPLADIAAFEAANNPDANQPDSDHESNANSVAALNGREAVVADAGGNSVLRADRLGAVDLLGVLPFTQTAAPAIPGFPVPAGTPIPVQSVPTSVALGRDGTIYVGQLTGFPFVPGLAKVWVIQPGQQPRPFADGFTLITDLALGKDGSLYVVEISTATLLGPPAPGALIRVKPDGSREELAKGQLTAPTGVALRGGFAYVSNHGNEAGTGEVVRIPLPDGGGDDDDNGDDD
jgi:hypothetical protein